MDLHHPYLTEQLIAYIGNKRSLLPFLHAILRDLPREPSRSVFLDPFAGSGSVSRLARLMGFGVRSNDWEYYSWVINSCHIGVGARELDSLFAAAGGFERIRDDLNGLPALPEDQAYIARHYAPRETARADWRTERLFYTRENAQVIDAVRSRIEQLYPGVPTDPRAAKEKAVLLAPLLYEAATHTNTSGVFKACHRGFGGHGGDALSRILAPIRLHTPVLVDTPATATVSCANAVDFLGGVSGDICYLDPPYAVHQYGSNYFMLNSIARWDKPPVSDERDQDGRFRFKAGIRSDWTRTRSAFCYKESAVSSLREVANAADCRWLVVSYSNEGLVGVEELCDLLSACGQLRVLSTPYMKYPGGKQSLSRTTRNIELVFVVDRDGPRVPKGPDVASTAVQTVTLSQLLVGSFDPRRIRASFPCVEGSICIEDGQGAMMLLPMRHYWRFAGEPDCAALAANPNAAGMIGRLKECALVDVREEIDVIAGLLPDVREDRERSALLREATRLLNKLAHRKNAAAFAQALRSLLAYEAPPAVAGRFTGELEAIAEKARRRSADSRERPK